MDVKEEILNKFNSINDQLNDPHRLDKLERIGFKIQTDLANASINYPNYKIISDNQVTFLCQKYNLIYTELTKYSEVIPKENLDEMDDFLKLYNRHIIYQHSSGIFAGRRYYHFNSRKEAISKWKDIKGDRDHRNHIYQTIKLTVISTAENILSYKNKDIRSEIKEPIVLAKPIINPESGYYNSDSYTGGWVSPKFEDYNLIISTWKN